jgi:hypothetical protein
VKIKGTHSVCGREVLAAQILDSQGHCPWDGQPFNRDYTGLLAEALQRAETAGSTLEELLEQVADMGGDFVLDADSILGALRVAVDRQRQTKPAGAR